MQIERYTRYWISFWMILVLGYMALAPWIRVAADWWFWVKTNSCRWDS